MGVRGDVEVVDLKKRFEGLEDEAFDLTLCLGTLTYMSPAARPEVSRRRCGLLFRSGVVGGVFTETGGWRINMG